MHCGSIASYPFITETYPLQIISERLGYNDVREFNAQFKSEIGISPGRFRHQQDAIHNYRK